MNTAQKTKLRAIPGKRRKGKLYSLVYGLRLYPVGEVEEVEEQGILLCNGTHSRIPFHLIEGTLEQIRAQLLASIDAFFDIYNDKNCELGSSIQIRKEESRKSGH